MYWYQSLSFSPTHTLHLSLTIFTHLCPSLPQALSQVSQRTQKTLWPSEHQHFSPMFCINSGCRGSCSILRNIGRRRLTVQKKRNGKRTFNKACVSPSAQLPVAKECSPVLSSACIRSQEDMEMNVFLQKNLQHTGHATFSPAMRR